MAIIFYDHLVTRNLIDKHLSLSKEEENQKGKALQLIDDILFQGIISFILDHLHDAHHHSFLSTLHERPYDPEILSFLKKHIGPDIEERIQKEADMLVSMILKDLKEVE